MGDKCKMAEEVLGNFMNVALPYMKLIGFIFLGALAVIAGLYYLLVIKQQRKWKIEIHEQKTDGKLHTVGYDTLIEKKRRFGTKTIYFLKKAKQECIPPPSVITDRYKGKEEVDYLRIDREMIPMFKVMKVNYSSTKVVEQIAPVYDKILAKIRNTKTTLLDTSVLRNKWMYIPVEKTLTTKAILEPIPYDMSMLAVNEISNADEFFKSKYEFWAKYGPVIVFGLTIVFLIVMAVLTYDYLTGVANGASAKLGDVVADLVNKGGEAPPVV